MKNMLKAQLDAGKKALGTFTSLGGAVAAESLGLAGLDYFILDTEHGISDENNALLALLGAKSQNITPLIRVKDASRSSILKMLDLGAMGLVVPFIQSVEEVVALIGRAKYAPVGERGYGLTRSSGFGCADYAQNTEEYFALSNRETLLLPQCETRGCLNDIEKIVALNGVDGIFVGPYDLSVSLGVAGQMNHPDLLAAIEKVLLACKAAGKYSFIFAGTVESANRYFEMGYDSVTCGVDAMLLIEAAKRMISEVRR